MLTASGETTSMKATSCLPIAILMLGSLGYSAVQEPAAPASKKAAKAAVKRYELGPDSLPREDVPRGKLEGPILFKDLKRAGKIAKNPLFLGTSSHPTRESNHIV
jgi:hypothetical protein